MNKLFYQVLLAKYQQKNVKSITWKIHTKNILKNNRENKSALS